jgi:hypothetical protein
MKRDYYIHAAVCKRKNTTDYTMFITECELCEKNSVKTLLLEEYKINTPIYTR